jgi:hypothetical protein
LCEATEGKSIKHHSREIGRTPSGDELNGANEHPTRSIEISDLWLSRRTSNSLKRAGIQTVADLESLKVGQLYDLRNCGKKAVEELIERLDDIGALSEELSHALKNNGLYEMGLVRDKLIDMLLVENTNGLLLLKDGNTKDEIQPRLPEEIASDIFAALSLVRADECEKASIRRLTKIQLALSKSDDEHAQKALIAIEKEAYSPSPVAILAETISGNTELDISIIPISATRIETEEIVRAIIQQTDRATVESGLKRIYRQCITNSLPRLDEKEDINGSDDEKEMSLKILIETFGEGTLDELRDRARKIEVDSSLRDMSGMLRQRIIGATMAKIANKRGISRERVRQLEKRFIEKYQLSRVDIMAEKLKERLRERQMALRLCEMDSEGGSIPQEGDLCILSRRIEVYRYFNCPVPISEYIKHLVVWEELQDRNRIGHGYWDSEYNLSGLLWAISIRAKSYGLMPKQTTLPRGVSAAVQRFGGQSVVARKMGMQYQGQIRGKDGRTYWTEEKIREYIREIQVNYFLPRFLMPERQQVKDFVDRNGMAAEKGNSCISAITKQLTLTWGEAAQTRGLKIYEECADEDMVEHRIVWRIIRMSAQESDCYYRLQGIWKGEDRIRRTERLIETYRHVVRIECVDDAEEEVFLENVKRSIDLTKSEIIDEIADMLF